ncbi:unnamed protein product [Acanthoscelides obtectus]|uniref:CRAL-TRIO domain-containing protein n=1 Tax=Acanthoscelides obtectus TaxID=200917 RepID=A0A9P0ML07_ACAOB|nr:unnamed protein product [Acanthoscelides obtectus]CAK1659634.1 hypothetical protein AOBTE_LOCUS21588 [Acanthoscelides obtectus]
MHYINVPSFAESIISLAKSFLKPKLQERIHIHSSTDGLKKYIPLEILPQDLEERSFHAKNSIVWF